MRFLRRNKKIIIGITSIVIIGILIFFGTKSSGMKINRVKNSVYAGNAFGTTLKKTLYSEDLTSLDSMNDKLDKCLKDLENQISVRIVTSEISKCNYNHSAGGQYQLSEDLQSYLKEEMEIYKESQGAYSPCMRPIAGLWGIEDGKQEVPDKASIQKALKITDADKVHLYDGGVILDEEGMMLDFGATGKGIACDKVREVLTESDLQGAVVSIGGSICVYGDKGDGKDWHIGIQNPRSTDGDVFAVVDVPGTVTISTSGDYEKYFEKDGVRYHHIFDPKTGYPADSGLISVTIISEDGLLSDGMSTACFVLGLEKGMDYANQKGVDAVFVTSDKKVYVTDGLKKRLRLQSEDYTLEKYKK